MKKSSHDIDKLQERAKAKGEDIIRTSLVAPIGNHAMKNRDNYKNRESYKTVINSNVNYNSDGVSNEGEEEVKSLFPSTSRIAKICHEKSSQKLKIFSHDLSFRKQ